MNPFEAHGIEHLSPSSLNTFAAEPALFVLQKVLKHPAASNAGPAAWRGSSVESGVAHGLSTGASTAECVALARSEFAKRVGLTVSEKSEKEDASIPGYVEQALEHLRPYGPPSSTQGRCEMAVEGLAVPIMGYYDFLWEDAGRLIDLKTAATLTSAIKPAHARQVAFYHQCLGPNLLASLTYCTPKKVATYALENSRAHWAALQKIARTVQRFLALSADPKELAGLVVPDVESFYYSDPEVRQAAFEAFGI